MASLSLKALKREPIPPCIGACSSCFPPDQIGGIYNISIRKSDKNCLCRVLIFYFIFFNFNLLLNFTFILQKLFTLLYLKLLLFKNLPKHDYESACENMAFTSNVNSSLRVRKSLKGTKLPDFDIISEEKSCNLRWIVQAKTNIKLVTFSPHLFPLFKTAPSNKAI